jgi:hypothetical protein
VTERLDIERVIRRTFSVFIANARTLVPTALLIYLPYLVVAAVTDVSSGGRATLGTFGADPDIMMLEGIETILSLLLGAVAAAATTWICAHAADGQPVGIRPAIGTALALGPAVLATSLLLSVLIIAGLVVFIVPGLVVMAMFFVAVPVVVVERCGVPDAFVRSRDLTRGNRLLIFVGALAFMVLVALIFLFAVIVPGIVVALLGVPGLFAVVAGALGAVCGVLSATFSFVVYDELSGFSVGGDVHHPLDAGG